MAWIGLGESVEGYGSSVGGRARSVGGHGRLVEGIVGKSVFASGNRFLEAQFSEF